MNSLKQNKKIFETSTKNLNESNKFSDKIEGF